METKSTQEKNDLSQQAIKVAQVFQRLSHPELFSQPPLRVQYSYKLVPFFGTEKKSFEGIMFVFIICLILNGIFVTE